MRRPYCALDRRRLFAKDDWEAAHFFYLLRLSFLDFFYLIDKTRLKKPSSVCSSAIHLLNKSGSSHWQSACFRNGQKSWNRFDCRHSKKTKRSKNTGKIKKNAFYSDETRQDANFPGNPFQNYVQYKSKEFIFLLLVELLRKEVKRRSFFLTSCVFLDLPQCPPNRRRLYSQSMYLQKKTLLTSSIFLRCSQYLFLSANECPRSYILVNLIWPCAVDRTL